MKNMKDAGKILLIAAIVLAGIAYEMYAWKECRKTNSFVVCMRIMSK